MWFRNCICGAIVWFYYHYRNTQKICDIHFLKFDTRVYLTVRNWLRRVIPLILTSNCSLHLNNTITITPSPAPQFSDADFASLSGARVVRIATHSDFQSMGYGTRALQLLADYYSGKITSLAEGPPPSPISQPTLTELGLLKESIVPRTHLPPLLTKLPDRPSEVLDYLGVSFGLTTPLMK